MCGIPAAHAAASLRSGRRPASGATLIKSVTMESQSRLCVSGCMPCARRCRVLPRLIAAPRTPSSSRATATARCTRTAPRTRRQCRRRWPRRAARAPRSSQLCRASGGSSGCTPLAPGMPRCTRSVCSVSGGGGLDGRMAGQTATSTPPFVPVPVPSRRPGPCFSHTCQCAGHP